MKPGSSTYALPARLLGVYIDSFTDPARGKTAALSQIDEGADVIFGGGGTTGSGAILGAAQAGVWVLGVDQDEYLTTFKQGEAKGANKLLSSAMKRVDNAVYGAIKMAVEGTFKGGTQVFDASNDGIGLAPFHATEKRCPGDGEGETAGDCRWSEGRDDQDRGDTLGSVPLEADTWPWR